MTTATQKAASIVLSSSQEKILLIVLAAVQFTSMVDFMIVIPLGPQFQDVFHITTGQFENIVGSYALSAGLAGLLGGFFIDRFDRKKVLMFIYTGFGVGTLCCAISPTYPLLVASRVLAGAFGGLCGSVIFAIVGDIIPMERRGRAMGLVMTSYSLASILGVPAGLIIANKFNWHVSFYSIAALTLPILVVALIVIPTLNHHLAHKHTDHPLARTWSLISRPNHLRAFAFMAALTIAGFSVIPYVPTYMVRNVGMQQADLFWLYVAGGICTVFSNNIVGRLSDKMGKQKVFIWVSVMCAFPILLVTNLPRVPESAAIATFALMMTFLSSRMVPALAMMTGVVEAKSRGGFMSLNSSVQQFTLGLTAMLTGLFMGQDENGHLTRFPINGIISILFAWAGIYLSRYLQPHKPAAVVAPEPVMVEG